MGDEHQGTPLCLHAENTFDALLLECGIPDGEYLVDENNFRKDVNGDAETEPRNHATGIALNRYVDELSKFRKIDDIVEELSHFLGLHSLNGCIKEDVLATSPLEVEASSKSNKCREAAVNRGMSSRRPRYTAEDTQQGRLSRAVSSNQCHRFTGLYGETYVLQCPKYLVWVLQTPLKG